MFGMILEFTMLLFLILLIVNLVHFAAGGKFDPLFVSKWLSKKEEKNEK